MKLIVVASEKCVYSREYLQRNCDLDIMSHADLTVYSGSTHEADRCLSDVSRVKQYAFTAMLLNMQTPAVFRNGRPTQSMRY